jgi:hypothetical protein
MVIIETPVFTKLIKELMSDEDYKELQLSLVARPDLGVLIRNSGGLRKLRWNLPGRGKSGGVRLIYYWMAAEEQLYMLLVYPKNVQDNLTAQQLNMLKAIIQRWPL